MGKMLEDYFSEIQADMVSICLEYVEKRAEKIYIYCSFEDGMISSGFFYKVNSKIVKKNKLNDVIVDGQKNMMYQYLDKRELLILLMMI